MCVFVCVCVTNVFYLRRRTSLCLPRKILKLNDLISVVVMAMVMTTMAMVLVVLKENPRSITIVNITSKTFRRRLMLFPSLRSVMEMGMGMGMAWSCCLFQRCVKSSGIVSRMAMALSIMKHCRASS